MNERRVVVHGRGVVQAWESSTDQVTFRRMEVYAKRPAGVRDLLPRGQCQRIVEAPGDGCRPERC
ncbi:MAG: hypothetical protein ACI9W2_000805 [Gammaproteobacteria bacterium]|jgi:hypothetical protein